MLLKLDTLANIVDKRLIIYVVDVTHFVSESSITLIAAQSRLM